MSTYRYTGPFEAVHVPTLGRDVARGESVEMPDGFALSDDWDAVEMSAADLRAALDADGISYPKSAKRADLQELFDSLTGDDS